MQTQVTVKSFDISHGSLFSHAYGYDSSKKLIRFLIHTTEANRLMNRLAASEPLVLDLQPWQEIK